MEIHGKVIKEPEYRCIYVVEDDKKQYQIVSEGEQAVKDYIFIRTGQEVQVKGKEIGKDKIQTEKSRIKINLSKGKET